MLLEFAFTADYTYKNKRLDQLLAGSYPEYSRATWQNWIKKNFILVNECPVEAKYKVKGEENISVRVILEKKIENIPQAIPLAIVYEDSDLLIVNKPAGLVVHPGAGCNEGTLTNALFHYDPELIFLPRAGLIHRLDKDTSGLLIVARTLKSYTALVKALQNREITREYQAIVKGKLIAGGTFNLPIGRHPKHRTQMTVLSSGKMAVTHYWILKRFEQYTLVQVRLETGRTHQIRVHFSHAKHPLLGDPIYGKFNPNFPDFKRQALHAYRLSFIHPTHGKQIEQEIPLPPDMQDLLKMLY